MEKHRCIWVICFRCGKDIDLKEAEPCGGPFLCHRCLKKQSKRNQKRPMKQPDVLWSQRQGGEG